MRFVRTMIAVALFVAVMLSVASQATADPQNCAINSDNPHVHLICV